MRSEVSAKGSPVIRVTFGYDKDGLQWLSKDGSLSLCDSTEIVVVSCSSILSSGFYCACTSFVTVLYRSFSLTHLTETISYP